MFATPTLEGGPNRVERQSWLGVIDTPKTDAGIRTIPLTKRLAGALGRIRRLRSEAVLV